MFQRPEHERVSYIYNYKPVNVKLHRYILTSTLHEFQLPFMLLESLKTILFKDVLRFLAVQLCLWFGFAIGASALYTTVQEDRDGFVYLKSLVINNTASPVQELYPWFPEPLVGQDTCSAHSSRSSTL